MKDAPSLITIPQALAIAALQRWGADAAASLHELHAHLVTRGTRRERFLVEQALALLERGRIIDLRI